MSDDQGSQSELAEGKQDEGKVFLSYSRKDRERAQGIADALRARHFGVFKDTDDILPTEEWKTRLQELIEEADTIVFLLSPHSAASEVCAWEVEYASGLNKRIAPIVIDDVEGEDIPPLLARLNFIFCTPRDPFENAVDTLVSALSTDIEWFREHTRIASLARRWVVENQLGRLLLRGQDIADGENWRDAHPFDAPAVTAVQARFISESRRAAARRQRRWIFGALGVATSTAALSIFAYFQSVEADRQRGVAVVNAEEAALQKGVALRQRDQALITQSLFLADLSAQRLEAGDDGDALALALSALPEAPSMNGRPLTPEALAALRDTRLRYRVISRFPAEFGVGNGFAASPIDGQLAMAMSGDGLLYDRKSGKVLAAYSGYENGAYAAAYSPEGDTFALASAGGVITIFDASTLDAVLSFDVGGTPFAMNYSLDGTRLAIGTADKRDSVLVVIDAASGAEMHRWGDYVGGITGVVFDPSGEYILTSAIDGIVRIYGLAKGQFLGGVHNSDYGLRALAIMPKKPVLAIAEAKVVVVKDIASGENLAQFDIGVSPIALAFAPAGDLFVGYVDGAILQWRIGQAEPIARFIAHDHQVTALAVSADGARLYSSSEGDAMITWRLQHEGTLELSEEGYSNGVALGLDDQGRLIRVGPADGGAIVTGADRKNIFLPLASPFVDAGLSNDKITTAEESGRVTLWSLEGEPLGAVETGIAEIIFAKLDGDILTAGNWAEGIRLFRFASGEEVSLPNNASISANRMDLQSGVFTFHEDEKLTVIDLNTPNSKPVAVDIPKSVFDMALSPDGKMIALGRQEGPDEVRDAATGALIATLDEPEGEAANAFAFSPDGAYLAASGLSGDYTAIWRVDNWSPVRIFRNDSGAGELAFSSDSTLLAYANNRDGRVSIVRTSDGKNHMSFPGDGGTMIYLRFAINDQRLVAATMESTRIWPTFPGDVELIEASTDIAGRTARLTLEDRCRYFLTTNDSCAIEEQRRAIIVTAPLPEK